MSNYKGYGTLSADGSTDWVSVRGWVTVTAHGDYGSGTLTWKYKGVDGIEQTILGGTDKSTAQAFTDDHMANFYFGTDVVVRGTLASSTSPDIDWQIMSNPANRSD